MTNDTMVISIDAMGNLQHTLRDGFFKPELGGRRVVERLSEILHNPEDDTFYIDWRKGPHVNTKTCGFKSYEDAVAYEVKQVELCRANGYVF